MVQIHHCLRLMNNYQIGVVDPQICFMKPEFFNLILADWDCPKNILMYNTQ